MLLVAKMVPLELDVQPAGEDHGEPGENFSRGIRPVRRERARDEALLAAGQAVQPLRVRGDLAPRHASLPLLVPERTRRDQAGEILVAGPVLDEKRETTSPVVPRNLLSDATRSLAVLGMALFERHLGSDESLDSGGLRRLVEPRRSVHAVRVDESDRRKRAVRGFFDEVLRKGGAVQKREGRRRAQLRVRPGLRARSGRTPDALPELFLTGAGRDDARIGGLEHLPTLRRKSGVNQLKWGQVSICHIGSQVPDGACLKS